MKKTNFLLLTTILITFVSCENLEKKTIKIYCETVNKAVNDTTISYSAISNLEEKTYNELILKNAELKNNTEFINSFNDNEDIKELHKSIKAKIIQNVQNILKKRTFKTEVDYRWRVHYLDFDGIMVKTYSAQIDLRGSYFTDNKTKKYTITLEENGKAYINLKSDKGEDLTLEFGKDETYYYIEINQRVYYSPINISKKVENEVETNESSVDTLTAENEEGSYISKDGLYKLKILNYSTQSFDFVWEAVNPDDLCSCGGEGSVEIGEGESEGEFFLTADNPEGDGYDTLLKFNLKPNNIINVKVVGDINKLWGCGSGCPIRNESFNKVVSKKK